MATEDKRIDQLPAVTSLELTSLLAMQQGSDAKKVTLQQLLDYLNGLVDAGNAVLFVAQTLTDDQKLQARTNIGAAAPGEGGGSAANAVLYVEQTLSEEQKYRARLNIQCGSVGVVSRTCYASATFGHAEGSGTRASGSYSHAEGYSTTASFPYSHAEGYYTTASGEHSHAEGRYTTASGYDSHAEGSGTTASGPYSHAEGYYTTAQRRSQHVQGEYNIEDDEGTGGTVRGKYAHIVGNGTADDARSNAHTLDWDGVPWFAGDRVMLGGTGMDDENAVALMPIFAAQTLTEEQKAQARTNIGAVGTSDLTAEVESALTTAKESGEFDGPAGPAGYTPVRGTDYWTEADQAAMVTDVLAALPVWEGGSY